MLTGMSVDGKAFTYVNQMATSEKSASNHREEWFDCACCPPNVARVLGHIGGYLWTPKTNSEKSATINVHLYASASLDYTLEGSEFKVKLGQETNYPWEGGVNFELQNASDVEVDINIRIPAWAGDAWEVSGTAFAAHYPLMANISHRSPQRFQPRTSTKATCTSTPPISSPTPTSS